ncbi:MAG: metallopeptidase family protein [Candidatus Staskawiczbacteria bacterium]|nr:metallopeptidase family protein [Candidatus Staskawiczbacteria bacterium]
MTHEEFEQLVREGIDSIDKKFLRKLKNVGIVIEDDPTPFQLEKLHLRGGFLFGLYEGIPQTKREGYGQVLPDKITIFKNPIEKFYSTPEDIKKAVKNTVWHEIAHHFGMDEHQVRQAERKK